MMRIAATTLAAALLCCLPVAAAAQLVRYESDLPRTMVFLQEDGTTASGFLTTFLAEAGFDVIDPAFARTTAERERARRALAGDRSAAVELGRDLGAQLIILGSAPADAAPNPAEPSLQVGTAELDVRAFRLDDARLVTTARTSGRAMEATPGSARAAALRRAAEQLLHSTAFLGEVANDWVAVAWDGSAYWGDDPSPGVVGTPGRDTGPLGIAIVDSDVRPDTADTGTRGLEVVARQARRASVRGFVPTPRAEVLVGGEPAEVRPLTAEERERYGLTAESIHFQADVPLAHGEDVVEIEARTDSESARAAVRPASGDRWAVVVGISEYTDSRIEPLRYAHRDAEAMHDFLRSEQGGSIPHERIRLLLNEDATAGALREALFVFSQQAAPEDVLMIYVAAHGAPDPNRPDNLYILTHDTDLDALAATAFPMWDFKTALRRHIAAERVIVVADACHSAGTGQSENAIGEAFSELLDGSRRLTISASGTDELSREGSQWGGGHGVFTHALLEGLGGAADLDGDGVVTFTEAARYVEVRVRAETNGRQNPRTSGLGDLPLTIRPAVEF